MAPIGGLAPVGRRYARLGLGVLALAAGVATLAIARHDAEESFGGRSVGDGILELAAGWSLVLAGLVWWARHPRRGFGPLLTAAGLAWFLPEWSSPAVGSSLVFTVGLVGIGLCAPLVASAALAYPRSGARSSLERAALAVAFGGAACSAPSPRPCSTPSRRLVSSARRISSSSTGMGTCSMPRCGGACASSSPPRSR
jgi:hypothetical protein